jgi:hypothetical protein
MSFLSGFTGTAVPARAAIYKKSPADCRAF